MLPFYLFCLKVVEELRRVSLQQPHELIDPQFETIELIRIHAMVLIVHEMLENEVDDV